MISSVRWLGIASLAMLLAAPSLAADADSTAVPSGARPSRGGVGGMIGVSWFNGTEDYSQGALPRFDFSGHYRYVMNRRFRWQVSPGFTWNAYSKNEPPPFVDSAFPADQTKESYLTLMIPISAQLQLTFRRGSWHYYLGAGPGLYRVWVQNHRKVLSDPQTLRLHRGLYSGASFELGAERFLRALPNTSAELSVVNHYVLAKRDDQFPSGWSSTLSAFAFRAGVNYYFDTRKAPKPSEIPLPVGGK